MKQLGIESIKSIISMLTMVAYGMIFGDLLNEGSHIVPLVVIAMAFSLSGHVLNWLLKRVKTKESPKS